jgi:hypothetical protein
MNQSKWQTWIKKLPSAVIGGITLVTAIISFAILIKTNLYLGVTILAGVMLLIMLLSFLYVAYARTPALIEGGQGVYRYERFRPLAKLGFIMISFIFFALVFIKSTRDIAVIGFTGTITPTPTSVPTVTPTPLAEIGTVNVDTTIDEHGTTVHTVRLSIQPIEYGNISVVIPHILLLNRSDIISVIIIPDSAIQELPQTPSMELIDNMSIAHQEFRNLNNSENPPDYIIMADNRIQIYPVMSVRLVGVNFDISPAEPQTFAIISSSPVEAAWTVTPLQEGEQNLILAVSIPVVVTQNTEQVVTYPLSNIPMQVDVMEPVRAANPMVLLLPCVFILTLVSFVYGVYRTVYRERKSQLSKKNQMST